MLPDKKFKVKKGKKVKELKFKKQKVSEQIAVDEKPPKPFPRNKNKISESPLSPQSPTKRPKLKQFDSKKQSFKRKHSNAKEETSTPLSAQSPAQKPTIKQVFDSKKDSFKRKHLSTKEETQSPQSPSKKPMLKQFDSKNASFKRKHSHSNTKEETEMPQSPVEKPTIKQLFDSRNASFKRKRSFSNTEDETMTSNVKAKKIKSSTGKMIPEERDDESSPNEKSKMIKVPRFLEDTLEMSSDKKPDRKEQRRLKKIAKQRSMAEGDRLKQTLFVGNLPMNITRKTLEKLFSQFGIVESVRLRGAIPVKTQIPKKLAEITRNFHKGLHSRKGFVVFKYAESVTDALSLNGTLIDDHHIIVDRAAGTGEKKYENKRTVFVGNLPFDVDDETVWNAFASFGDVQAVRVIRDATTGAGKGFGYVLFQTEDSKQAAIKKESVEVNGRSVRIKPVEGSKNQKGPKQQNFKHGLALKARSKRENPQSRKSTKKLLKKEKFQHDKKKIASSFKKFL